MQITEEWIQWHAPGPVIVKKGRELSEKGCFSARCYTADKKTCWAECSGSAHNPYYAFLDWSIDEREPGFGCSCSSPHHPCKHVCGLMYELYYDKPFTVAEIPPYVLKAREKFAKERAREAERLARARRYDAAVRDKKLERQLEALAKAEALSDELLRGGLDAISELPSQSLERMATELGNYELPSAQAALEHAAYYDRLAQQDEELAPAYRAEMVRNLAALRVLIARARGFLDTERAPGSYGTEDPVLYEQLGGVWKNEELRELGSCRRNARLVQLSFDVSHDAGRRIFVERGFWAELTQGDLVQTYTSRRSKDGKYTAVEDTCFDLLETPLLYEAPNSPFRHVWWEDAVPSELTTEDREAVLRCAVPRLADVMGPAREQIAEPLMPGWYAALVAVGRVGYVDGVPVLEDPEGGRIALRDRDEDGGVLASVGRLMVMQDPPKAGDALFGLLFYDDGTHSICLHPYSLVTADEIIRLQF